MVLLTDETSSLQQFKKVVSDLNQNERVLLRFLRARDYDVNCAEKMLRNAVQWRKEIGLDEYCPKKWIFPPHYYSDMKVSFHGRDYDLAPISWLFLGRWTVKQLLETEDPEQIQRYCFGVIEQGLQKTIECGCTGNVIIDMDGFSYTQATHIPTLKLAYFIFQGFEQYFPEIVKAIYIINAPWIFSFSFNFLKGVFAQKTMEKITIFSYKEEWHAEFLKRFPRESILPELQPPYTD